MTTVLEACRNTIGARYIKANGLLAMTMVVMDAVALAGYVLLGLELAGLATGPFAVGLAIATGHAGAWLRKRTDVPMSPSPAVDARETA